MSYDLFSCSPTNQDSWQCHSKRGTPNQYSISDYIRAWINRYCEHMQLQNIAHNIHLPNFFRLIWYQNTETRLYMWLSLTKEGQLWVFLMRMALHTTVSICLPHEKLLCNDQKSYKAILALESGVHKAVLINQVV